MISPEAARTYAILVPTMRVDTKQFFVPLQFSDCKLNDNLFTLTNFLRSVIDAGSTATFTEEAHPDTNRATTKADRGSWCFI